MRTATFKKEDFRSVVTVTASGEHYRGVIFQGSHIVSVYSGSGHLVDPGVRAEDALQRFFKHEYRPDTTQPKEAK